MKRRFLCGTDTTDQLISAKDICNLTWVCTTGGASGTQLTALWRIIKIEMWGIQDVSAQLDWTTVSLTWLPWISTTASPPVTVSDTGNAMRPAHIVAHPPLQSLDRMWNNGNINRDVGPFSLTAPAGTVLDITLENYICDYTLGIYGFPTAGSLVTIGGTTGYVYHNALDNTSLTAAAAGPLRWTPLGPFPYVAAWN